MTRPESEAGREPDPADSARANDRHRASYDDECSERISADHDADAALAEIRRWERASRIVADHDELSIEAKRKALLEMMASARRSELAAFLEIAIWRGCRHFFEDDVLTDTTDTISAIRRLLRQGRDRCPECRRPLPDDDTLDYWRELTHDYRRPA